MLGKIEHSLASKESTDMYKDTEGLDHAFMVPLNSASLTVSS